MEAQGETESAGSWFGVGLCEFLRNSALKACSFLKTALGARNSLYSRLGGGDSWSPSSSPAWLISCQRCYCVWV